MRLISILLMSLVSVGVLAQQTNAPEIPAVEVNAQALSIKQSVLELNKDLYQLEQDLLSPATTRAAVYFSLDKGKFYQPYSINIVIDNKAPIQYLYTDKQVHALRQGAVQPLKNLNLGPGKHSINAVVKGVSDKGVERDLTIKETVEKNDGPLYIELKVQENAKTGNAELIISQW